MSVGEGVRRGAGNPIRIFLPLRTEPLLRVSRIPTTTGTGKDAGRGGRWGG